MLRRTRNAIIENVLCLVVLAVLPLSVCVPGLRNGDIPLALESALLAPPWQEARPAGVAPADDPLARTQAQRYFPWFRFMHASAQRGDSVLWYPDEGFGAPFLAAWRTRALSPFSLPLYFKPPEQGLWWSVALKMLVAAWCAFYTMRRFGFAPPSAMVTAVAFQFGGPVLLGFGQPLSDVVPWLPLLLVTVERLAFGNIRAWSLGAITIALMVLGGSPETVAAVLAFMVLYLVVRWGMNMQQTRLGVGIAGLLLATVFGLGLVAVQLAPYIEFRLAAEQGVSGLGRIAPLRGWGFLALLAPGLAPEASSCTALLLPLGLVQSLLFVVWCALRRFVDATARRRVEALFLAALLLLALGFGRGLFAEEAALAVVPGPQYFLIAHALVLAVMAAAALEEWLALGPEEVKASVRRFLLYAPVVWGAVLGLLSWAALHFEPAAGRWSIAVAVGSAAVILVLLGVTMLRPSPRLLGYSLAALTAACSWWTAARHLPTTDAELAFPETSFVTSLQSLDTRVAGSPQLAEWPLAANGIPQVYAPGGLLLDRSRAFLERAQAEPLLMRRTGTRGLLLTKEDVQGAFARLRPQLRIDEIYAAGAVLFTDLDARPRARMIYAGRSVAQFKPSALDAGEPPLLEDVALPKEDDGPAARTEIVQPERNGRVVVRVEETRPGVLVLADAWYPGWRATVDGKPAAIRPVDGAFRGVELGAGTHEVVFSYEPESLRIGAIISLVCGLWVLISLRHMVFAKRG